MHSGLLLAEAFSESKRGRVEGCLKVANKAAVIVEAAFVSDFCDRSVATAQFVASYQEAKADDVFARARPEYSIEASLELACGDPDDAGNFWNRDPVSVVLSNVVDELVNGVVRVVEYALVALNDSANSDHFVLWVAERKLLGDEPFRQSLARGKELDEVQQRVSSIENV